MNPKNLHTNDNPYRHILVALDGSASAEQVLPYIESLAERHGSAVTLLRVVTPVEVLLFAGSVLEPMVTRHYAELDEANAEERAETARYLASLAGKLAGKRIAVDYAAPAGAPAKVIVEEAQRRGADLIAMTTHGREGLSRVVFGSVADDVMRHAPCPVLLVRVGGVDELPAVRHSAGLMHA